jgi:hypothetical protein
MVMLNSYSFLQRHCASQKAFFQKRIRENPPIRLIRVPLRQAQGDSA